MRKNQNTFEKLLSYDPAGRRVCRIACESPQFGAEGAARAAASLAEHAAHVAIVTGFPILIDGRPVAETDGPPGALYLAAALSDRGVTVRLITDEVGIPLISAGCEFLGFDRSCVDVIPFEGNDPESYRRRFNRKNENTIAWIRSFLASEFGQRLTHLIAIERPGPSYTTAALQMQQKYRRAVPRDFHDTLPKTLRNICQSMRGELINAHVAKTHLLFEEVKKRSASVVTIGIGDGGNELGMGTISWRVFAAQDSSGLLGKVACRIPTDYTILAGISNLGAYALANLVLLPNGAGKAKPPWGIRTHRTLLRTLVRRGGAVDGVTKAPTPSVDGLPLENYLDLFHGLQIATRSSRMLGH